MYVCIYAWKYLFYIMNFCAVGCMFTIAEYGIIMYEKTRLITCLNVSIIFTYTCTHQNFYRVAKGINKFGYSENYYNLCTQKC